MIFINMRHGLTFSSYTLPGICRQDHQNQYRISPTCSHTRIILQEKKKEYRNKKYAVRNSYTRNSNLISVYGYLCNFLHVDCVLIGNTFYWLSSQLFVIFKLFQSKQFYKNTIGRFNNKSIGKLNYIKVELKIN